MKPMMAVVAAANSIASLSQPANAGEANCSTRAAASVEVDVRANGDDGLTQRLWDATRAAYGACGSGYTVTERGESGKGSQ